jgi:ATP-grasp domain
VLAAQVVVVERRQELEHASAGRPEQLGDLGLVGRVASGDRHAGVTGLSHWGAGSVEEREESGNVRKVVVVSPSERDVTEIRSAGLDRRYDVTFAGPDLDALDRLDGEALVAELGGLAADGIVSSKDRGALLAAVLASRRGLPGPSPRAVAACQHKPTARALQERAVPEATPRWFVSGEREPPFGPPWFVKPAVGRLSMSAHRVDDEAQLPAVGGADAYAEGWQSLARLGGVDLDGHGWIAEAVLEGAPLTIEGYVHRGEVTIVGVTDSVMYEGTLSFERFEYPSRLPAGRVAEVSQLAARLPGAFGFDNGFFNAECVVPDSGPPGLIELNGRIASQFAPLLRAVHGRSSYDALLALACGEDPRWDASPADGVAVSYVLRRFEDAWVEAAPEPEAGVEILVHTGQNLSDAYANDPGSFRLAIVYEAGETRAEAVARARARAAGLRFLLGPPRPA